MQGIYDEFNDLLTVLMTREDLDTTRYDTEAASQVMTPEYAAQVLEALRYVLPEEVPYDLTVDDIVNNTEKYLEFLNAYTSEGFGDLRPFGNKVEYTESKPEEEVEYESEESRVAHETLGQLVTDINNANNEFGYYDATTKITPEMAQKVADAFSYLAEHEGYEELAGITVDDIISFE